MSLANRSKSNFALAMSSRVMHVSRASLTGENSTHFCHDLGLQYEALDLITMLIIQVTVG